MKPILLVLFFSSFFMSLQAQEKKQYKIITIAFYNVENLFDTINDPVTFDDDRTPGGKDNWTQEVYKDKLQNMAFAIKNIGAELAQDTPALIGLSEIENRKVLEDLINEPLLAEKDYGIVHFDSPDRRGIDVALLYRKEKFIPMVSVSRELLLYDSYEPGKRVYTRDQLVVTGYLDGEKIHVIVNHWPSRSGGVAGSSYKRNKAAALNKKIIDSLQLKDPYAKIITMGDFNDDPSDKSLSSILGAKANKKQVGLKGMYNPMAALSEKGIGSSAYRDSWNLFDQIILSETFLKKDFSSYQFYQANIFNANFLITDSGQYKGYPYRSFGYSGYTGGYSDHFPVYIYLIKRISN